MAERRDRILTVDHRYLVFPRWRDAGNPTSDAVSVAIDGEPYFAVGGAGLASHEPDFYTFLDLDHARGREVTVEIEGENADAIDLVRTADRIPSAYVPYGEPERPLVHFSPLRGWLNDPSGLLYLDGQWHLYYANNRFANRMAGPDNAWAHAVSPDLVHWREVPLFLCPIRGTRSFWTGGAAIDIANTTGEGRPGSPVVVFSANNGSDAPNAFTQCVFVSTDGGATCTLDPRRMYVPLPAEAHRRGGGTRDPMILWWEPERKWVMIVYNHPPGGRPGFYFFESRDLTSWAETSVLEDQFECPNLVVLPVDGNPSDSRWVIWGSSSEYLVGSFDGSRFHPDGQGKLRTHHGPFTASQVFANAPVGRVVQVGWAHCCNFDREFSQMASFPLELSLRSTGAGVRLHAEFVEEIRSLRLDGWQWSDVAIEVGALLIG
ncbi:MAG TPA: glycoside hydrolase family 32 protein, partial [Spirochaetia bacterium]|nr:glycoside hydrolase family 32 protein [Spirochaetia bacterium]